MMAPPLCTREDAIAAAARVFSRALDRIARQTDEEVARAAYLPGGPSIAELTALVASLRIPQP
ncbi:hypothetical protein GCM10022221_22510 [Actinocorallia aurea]